MPGIRTSLIIIANVPRPKSCKAASPDAALCVRKPWARRKSFQEAALAVIVVHDQDAGGIGRLAAHGRSDLLALGVAQASSLHRAKKAGKDACATQSRGF